MGLAWRLGKYWSQEKAPPCPCQGGCTNKHALSHQCQVVVTIKIAVSQVVLGPTSSPQTRKGFEIHIRIKKLSRESQCFTGKTHTGRPLHQT